ncbi:MAG: PHP domain-containing protein [Clostridia bacterium]|nr:PHP domain-containing protein [Clostridia bacterium]
MELDKIIKLVKSNYKIYTAEENKEILQKYCYLLYIDNGQKEVYIFIGPSGSGKTTFVSNLYESGLLKLPYVNRFVFNEMSGGNTTLSDEISTKLSLAKYGRSFVLETASTDSGNIRFYKKLKKLGYTLNIFIMVAKDIGINLSNIIKRQSEGGHTTKHKNIENEIKKVHKHFAKILSIGDNVVYVKNMTSDSNARLIVPLKEKGVEISLNKDHLLTFMSTPNLTFDLHMHTKFSDGTHTLDEILELIDRENLDFVSITDHNSIDAHLKLQNMKIDKSKFVIIPGAEINVVYNDYRLELLAYGFDVDKMKHFKNFKPEVRMEYYNKQLDALKAIATKLGLKFTKNLKPSSHRTPAGVFYIDLRKYKENDDYFTKLGVTSKNQFIRQFCYQKGSEFYVEDFGTPNLVDVCNYIHKAGGIAVLAHIYAYELNKDEANKVLNDIIKEGCLDGIETLYSSFTEEEIMYLKKLCKKHNLIATGGSDYHKEVRVYNGTKYDTKVGNIAVTNKPLNTNMLK